MNRDTRVYGIIGTIIFHLLLLALLYFNGFIRVEPKEEESGVLVQFGNVDEAAGTFEPENTGEQAQLPDIPEPVTPPEPAPKQELVTQNIEESVALNQEKKKADEKRKKEQLQKDEEKRRLDDIKRREDEVRKKKEAEQQKANAIQNKISGAFGKGNTSGSHGTSDKGTGNQGNPFGNSDTGKTHGVGGMGQYDLGGRSIGQGGLPLPSYQINEEGRIVVNIVVNPNGIVVAAEIGKGTNIDNGTLRNEALKAARKARFVVISGHDNQSGTITYVYKLR